MEKAWHARRQGRREDECRWRNVRNANEKLHEHAECRRKRGCAVRKRRKNEEHVVGKHSESLANEHESNRVRNGRKAQWEQPGFQARWKSWSAEEWVKNLGKRGKTRPRWFSLRAVSRIEMRNIGAHRTSIVIDVCLDKILKIQNRCGNASSCCREVR